MSKDELDRLASWYEVLEDAMPVTLDSEDALLYLKIKNLIKEVTTK